MLKPRYTGCVYLATNTTNGRAYIGKTKMPLRKRIRCHKSAASRDGTTPFNRSIRKYGIAAFRWDVLFMSADDAALYAAERELIADTRAAGVRLYNRTDGGEGAPGGFWSTAARKRLSRAMKGRVNSAEARAKMSAAAKGKPKSAEHIDALRKARTGIRMVPWTDERRAKHAATWARKRAEGSNGATPERRAAQSAAAKRRWADPAERAKLSEAGKKGAKARWG